MLHVVEGDLLESWKDGVTHIGQQCNCMMGFGSGIAGQIRQRLRGAFEAFAIDGRLPEEKFGSFSVGRERVGNFTAVYNIYSQFSFGGTKLHTDYEKLEKSLELILSELYLDPEVKFALPYKIGCGLANGSWETVYSILEKTFLKYRMDCYLYYIDSSLLEE